MRFYFVLCGRKGLLKAVVISLVVLVVAVVAFKVVKLIFRLDIFVFLFACLFVHFAFLQFNKKRKKSERKKNTHVEFS